MYLLAPNPLAPLSLSDSRTEMIIEKPLLPYFQWLLQFDGARWGALPHFIAVLLILAVVAILLSLLIGTVLYGPLKAGDKLYRVVVNSLVELSDISPRRIWALSRLAIQESLRGRVLVAVVVFIVMLLFAGWFLKTDRDPARLYFSFVLTATSFLGLFVALLLAVFSLPNDFKSKTIYTVLTKPVRAGEIVLGRILGFTVVGTGLLAIMGVCSYVFVARALDHTHAIALQGQLPEATSVSKGHRHLLTKNEAGEVIVAHASSHNHTATESDGRLTVSAPLSIMRARVPKSGKLRFIDRNGNPKDRGISVGKEWGYRSFIEGGSQAAAIWTYDGIDETVLVGEDQQEQYLPIELVVRVFRTWKGKIDVPVQGVIQLKRPNSELKTEPLFFSAKDASLDSLFFARKLTDTNNQPIDLIDDLVDEEGRIEVVVQCLDRAQYFGFAQGDCYIRLKEGSPLWNFVKAYISMWVQMVLVIAIAVTGSTVLSGPIAMIFTMSFILLGFQRDFFVSVAQGTQEGGGPVEAFVRIFAQMNLTSGFREQTFPIWLMKTSDLWLRKAMVSLAQVLPDFSLFDTSLYVASGFDIPANQIAQQLTTGLGYVIGLAVIGYFLLRTREVAR